MRIVVLSGMSGSGKSTARRALEDMGFYAIDNLPLRLLDKVVELFGGTMGEVEKLAIVVDARWTQAPWDESGTGDLPQVPQMLERTREAGHRVDLVYLDAADDVIERRFSETRRKHPLSPSDSVRAGIERERMLLDVVAHSASMTVDTSSMSVHDLRRAMQARFGSQEAPDRMSVTVQSFGFKYGLPVESDLVFDVRFLPNPYFDETLRPHTGLDDRVARFVLGKEATRTFVEKTRDLLRFLLPQYQAEGKAYLTVSIGCTGGRHRSVALAEDFGTWMAAEGFPSKVRHRDTGRVKSVLPAGKEKPAG